MENEMSELNPTEIVEDIEEAAEKISWLDGKLGKFASRKLLVLILSTLFFVLAMIDSDQWLMIATAYIGVQGFADIIFKWRESK